MKKDYKSYLKENKDKFKIRDNRELTKQIYKQLKESLSKGSYTFNNKNEMLIGKNFLKRNTNTCIIEELNNGKYKATFNK